MVLDSHGIYLPSSESVDSFTLSLSSVVGAGIGGLRERRWTLSPTILVSEKDLLVLHNSEGLKYVYPPRCEVAVFIVQIMVEYHLCL